MSTILHVIALALGLAKFPEMTPERSLRVAAMAVMTETPHASAELLAALAWAESRGDSKVVTGKTCGILQVNPSDLELPWTSTCEQWARSPIDGMRGGVLEIELMLRDGRVGGNLMNALRYRACGNAAFDPKSDCAARKAPWIQGVLDRARFLRGTHNISAS
jgi:hypothetical protein